MSHVLFNGSMTKPVAIGAKGDQILFAVVSATATKPDVVNLEMMASATDLALPAIALKHIASECAVGIPVQLQSRIPFMRHAATCTRARNSRCWSGAAS